MENVEMIPLTNIAPNPFQPRTYFDEQLLKELSASISENGLIQPVVVRKSPEGYQLIVGERRLRAARELDLNEIPAIIIEADDYEAASLALIENIQRSDLSPIEEARAYKQLLSIYHQTQQELAQRLGRTQSSIANKLRLLTLDDAVQEELQKQTISERHGRALLALNPEQQKEALKKIIDRNLNVKETEKYISEHYNPAKKREHGLIRCFGVSTQIAINTVRQAVRSLKNLNVPVEINEQADDEAYTMTITIKKAN